MYEARSIAVVVPAYNEEAHVADVITGLPGFVDRIYAIDDASSDGTFAEIRRAAERENRGSNGRAGRRRVVPVRHEENRGAGGAVLTGYRHAYADGMDVIAVMDGDGQMDPDDLERIVAPVANGEVDYAKGNRLHYPADRAMMSRWRLFGNSILTMLTRAASGYWEMADPQNGFTAISREALSELPLDRLYTDYGFLNDMLVHLNQNRAKIADVSHRGVYGAESSGITYRHFIPGLSALLASRFVGRLSRMYVIRRFHPLVVCYAFGVLTIGIGTIGGIAGIASSAGSRLLGGLVGFGVAMVGMTLLTLGMAFDVDENRDLVTRYAREAPDRGPETVPSELPPAFTPELASDGGEESSVE